MKIFSHGRYDSAGYRVLLCATHGGAADRCAGDGSNPWQARRGRCPQSTDGNSDVIVSGLSIMPQRQRSFGSMDGMKHISISSALARTLVAAAVVAPCALYGSGVAYAGSIAAHPKARHVVDTPLEHPRTEISLADVKGISADVRDIKDLSGGVGFASFVQGEGPLHVTVYIDPNCIFCHRFWKALTHVPGWFERYTVRWVPVGFLKPSSQAKAANVLRQGTAGLAEDESGFNVKKEEGAIKPLRDPALQAKIAANTKRWAHDLQKLGLPVGTPTIATATGDVFAGLVPLARIDKADRTASD